MYIDVCLQSWKKDQKDLFQTLNTRETALYLKPCNCIRSGTASTTTAGGVISRFQNDPKPPKI